MATLLYIWSFFFLHNNPSLDWQDFFIQEKPYSHRCLIILKASGRVTTCNNKFSCFLLARNLLFLFWNNDLHWKSTKLYRRSQAQCHNCKCLWIYARCPFGLAAHVHVCLHCMFTVVLIQRERTNKRSRSTNCIQNMLVCANVRITILCARPSPSGGHYA